MAGTFPTIKSGRVTCFGFSRSNEFQTTVNRFLDNSEQRWQSRTNLMRGTLVFTDIGGYDRSQIQAFWLSAKGAFDGTWTLPPLAAGYPAYANCAFADDPLQFVETKPNRFSGELKIIQTSGSI